MLIFQVVELLNQASLQPKDSQRITILRKVQELIVHKDPDLLDSFLDVSTVVFKALSQILDLNLCLGVVIENKITLAQTAELCNSLPARTEVLDLSVMMEVTKVCW